ncbi:hypothetical protein AVA77_18685 [Salmonella enterica subsp. enterica serovar Typhi]|uniref:hypothetical protein n=1 Tax=Escherichia coli TaxID=562 RepID=UPI0005E658DC|nr:hypothetical protein [Escherichia coli]ECY4951226.1 hypothetical protein [Salmonella enterica subsp. enterica serovar Typhi]EHQ7426598.1 hypothetical protein [Salmonella enterica subsp. enterica]HAD5755123.1 hypothetical protein [Salmonella enterica subsp. enterica serovar Typhi str. CT18]ECY6419477.1 hypothetical protein [Salmonella enterica subsp. enterica serovar Typhi]EIV9356932.1 hypothetical protein [Escherichia coli]
MLFNQNDWKLQVTDIDLYANTCKLDGESYPLSLALKTLIPGYMSGFSPRAAEPLELLEVLAEAGVTIANFFGKDLMSAYQRRQVSKREAAAEAEKTMRIQAERMAELNMTEEERIKANQKRDQQKAERQAYGDSIRNAVSSAGRSRAAIVADLESGGNWMDAL